MKKITTADFEAKGKTHAIFGKINNVIAVATKSNDCN